MWKYVQQEVGIRSHGSEKYQHPAFRMKKRLTPCKKGINKSLLLPLTSYKTVLIKRPDANFGPDLALEAVQNLLNYFRMKNLKFLALACTAVITFSSCSSDDDGDTGPDVDLNLKARSEE